MIEWVALAASVSLVAACGVFVAAEFSLLAADRAVVEQQAAHGDRRARGVLAALRGLSTQLAGVQVGITLTNLAIGLLSEPARSANRRSRTCSTPPSRRPACRTPLVTRWPSRSRWRWSPCCTW